MGAQRPTNPDLNGDESAVSPRFTNEGLLGHKRGTDQTKRIETDDSGNLYTSLAGASSSSLVPVSPLATGTVTVLTAATLATVTTYAAPTEKRITRISVSGTIYAKWQIVINTVVVENFRTGPDRSHEFKFSNPLLLNASDILDIKVAHYFAGHTEDFNATIYGV